jgi:hypothetical protein
VIVVIVGNNFLNVQKGIGQRFLNGLLFLFLNLPPVLSHLGDIRNYHHAPLGKYAFGTRAEKVIPLGLCRECNLVLL